ncbi:hypothetical protein FH972_027077 [Carpinus fangiana]|uniref:Wall-associated receptor kinase galacturonan-binding domain-containing protein n=1 Tax=Carpinus fangiana TaxID=176857 RepID=A0A5N6L8C8_9ROSI|nr:hypothetical protein FH972_027077 [Carpinus fangiana]
MARGMLFPAGLMVLIVVLVLVHEACSANDSHHHSCHSSCGNIHNISYPFRLKDDPPICGDQRYNLYCENNQTVLYLFARKYHMLEIDYIDYTIRVVDAGIHEKGNISFIPSYFLNNYNFSSGDPYTLSYPENIYFSCKSGQYQRSLSNGYYRMGVVWVKCEKPVISDDYLDTSTCLSNGVNSTNSSLFHSKGYRYVLYSDSISQRGLGDLCQVEQMFPSVYLPYEPITSITCSDVYRHLVYGFELIWVQVFCDNFTGDDVCNIDNVNFIVDNCYDPTQDKSIFGKGEV